MFCSHKEEIEKLERRISDLESRNMSFLSYAQKVLETIMDNDKRKFMYELQQEDVRLIRDGQKIESIRKILVWKKN